MNKEPRKLKSNESDSVIEYGLKHNEKLPIAYKGKWYPAGWFQKALEAAKSKSGGSDE